MFSTDLIFRQQKIQGWIQAAMQENTISKEKNVCWIMVIFQTPFFIVISKDYTEKGFSDVAV